VQVKAEHPRRGLLALPCQDGSKVSRGKLTFTIFEDGSLVREVLLRKGKRFVDQSTDNAGFARGLLLPSPYFSTAFRGVLER
jgi:hypothetical protein